MTVAVQALPITYNGNGTAAPLAVPFRFLAPDHLVVTRIAASGTRTVLTRGTHYSVAGGGDAQSGTVTPLAAIAVGDKWEIDRATPREQPTNYPVGDDFPAETHERALDRNMMIAQEQDRRTALLDARAVKVPEGETAGSLPPLAQRASRLPAFNSIGGLGVLGGINGVVALDALGQPFVQPLTTVIAALGTTLIDDGAWGGDVITADDGAWG